MPRGHGRIGSNAEQVAGRRNLSLLRRSLGENTQKFPTEEHRISTLTLGNIEQRCIFVRLVAPELDGYCEVAAFLQLLRGLERTNHLPSAATLSESPLAITLLVNLHNIHRADHSQNTCSSESSLACISSSGMDITSRSCNGNKRTKSLKNLSTRGLAVDTSSSSLCDSSSPVSSDDLISNTSKVEKTLKKNSKMKGKKKGKKKGKHYKRPICKKDSNEMEGDCERCAPAVEPEHIPKKLSENPNNCVDTATTMMSCISSTGDMEESEAADSMPQGFSIEEFTNSSSFDVKTRVSIKDKEADSNSKKYNSSFDDVVLNDNYWSESVVDAHSSTDRAQCSNGFQLVKSGKRGRTSKRTTAHTVKDGNNHPVWQKVQKDAYAKVDTPSDDYGARARLNASPSLNQRAIGKTTRSREINVRKKHTSVSMEPNHYWMKGSHNSNTNLSRPYKVNAQHIGCKILPQATLSEISTNKHIGNATFSDFTSRMETQLPSSAALDQIGFSASTLNSSGQCDKIDSKEHTEYNEADNNFGPESRKPVPVQSKDASVKDEPISTMVDSKNAEAALSSEVRYIVSSRSGDDADSSSTETDILSEKLMSSSCTAAEFIVSNELNSQLTHEVRDQKFSKLKTDLNKIVHATAASKLQTGAGPLAEFERFMRSASPVISQRHHNKICMACSGEQLNINSTFFHQICDISLASLWQWYEEPGCYGLEVKVEDNHRSKRLCDGFAEFRAYFVPYLSAVQLFGRSGSSCEVDKASRSLYNLGSLPIFSALLPQPHKEEDAINGSEHSVKNTNLIDEEPIFEYFEHAQPPQRRPLFEKIKELISGDPLSNSTMYGDPLKLENMSLDELHPASWFSVAWYPIYRIPEGNFRAAFLTYHSLGHYIHQSASSNMAGDTTLIISPVVGLQSYNAKKECWFQPKDMKSMEVHKEEMMLSPSKLMEERLWTLEKTASVMATATVRKGNQKSVNNHPDYNHFFSRW